MDAHATREHDRARDLDVARRTRWQVDVGRLGGIADRHAASSRLRAARREAAQGVGRSAARWHVAEAVRGYVQKIIALLVLTSGVAFADRIMVPEDPGPTLP